MKNILHVVLGVNRQKAQEWCIKHGFELVELNPEELPEEDGKCFVLGENMVFDFTYEILFWLREEESKWYSENIIFSSLFEKICAESIDTVY